MMLVTCRLLHSPASSVREVFTVFGNLRSDFRELVVALGGKDCDVMAIFWPRRGVVGTASEMA